MYLLYLTANEYVGASRRLFEMNSHNEMYTIYNTTATFPSDVVDSEFGAVRWSIIAIYFALPSHIKLTSHDNYQFMLEKWPLLMVNALTPVDLMECLILLQNFTSSMMKIGRPYITLNSLPSFHLAIRRATLSSCALRSFCLDETLKYGNSS